MTTKNRVKLILLAIIAVLGMAFFFWLAALAYGSTSIKLDKAVKEFDSAIESYIDEKETDSQNP